MGIRGIENLTGAGKGATVYITEDNHQWVAEMTGMDLVDIQMLYTRSVEQGTPCSIDIAPDKC